MSRITIVSGLPRTGTSMMMAMLKAGGMEVVVDDLRKPDVDNPKGYYEFEKVKKIKEDPSWIAGARGKAFKMVSMLLYDLPEGEEYKIIFMEREMDETVVSQNKMLARLGQKGADDDAAATARLYGKHLGEVKAWLSAQRNMDVLYVSYNDVLKEPSKNAEAVARFIGSGLDVRKMSGAVDSGLYRNRSRR